MFQQLLRTSRYYMPPRITRNSHRPSDNEELESQIEPWLAVLKTDHGNDYSKSGSNKGKNKNGQQEAWALALNGFGCVECGLAAKNFRRLGRIFFLDSPFIEPLPVL
mgnify:CR=1 FL=1